MPTVQLGDGARHRVESPGVNVNHQGIYISCNSPDFLRVKQKNFPVKIQLNNSEAKTLLFALASSIKDAKIASPEDIEKIVNLCHKISRR